MPIQTQLSFRVDVAGRTGAFGFLARSPVPQLLPSLVFCRVKAYVGVVHLLQKPLVPLQ